MTKPAFENAIALTSALGGSTNAVLHLLAIANEAGCRAHLDDFNRIAARVPHIADMKPGGKFHMSDLDRVGGVPVVLRHLLDAGLLHGDVGDGDRPDDGREPGGARPAARPTASSSTRSTRRSTRRAGSTSSPARWRRAARSSRSPGSATTSSASRARPGCSTARRRRWPRSSPAASCPARCSSSATRARRAARACARCSPSRARSRAPAVAPTARSITDGRFSGGTWGFCIGHVAPEAVDGGPIAFVRDGDRDPHRRADEVAGPARRRRRAGGADGRVGPEPGPLHAAVCWASTRGWCRAPRPAPSPTCSEASELSNGRGDGAPPRRPRCAERAGGPR